jgi:rare lipoprotein A
MNVACRTWSCSAIRRTVLAATFMAFSRPAVSQDLEWLWAAHETALENPWALGVKPQSGWRLRVAPPLLPKNRAVLDRSWPATVRLASPEVAIATGALTPVAFTPYSTPNTTGLASFYWQEQTTSSGERFDKTALTAAHRTLPMHSRVRVTRLDTGRSVIVRINDRGPFKPGRIIDLSAAAAEALGMKTMGLAEVRLDVIR